MAKYNVNSEIDCFNNKLKGVTLDSFTAMYIINSIVPEIVSRTISDDSGYPTKNLNDEAKQKIDELLKILND